MIRHARGSLESSEPARAVARPLGMSRAGASAANCGSAASSSGSACAQSATSADIRDLENRRVGILVDRDDRARILDAGQVLDRARDADRDVELRRDDLARLTDLQIVRHEPRVDRRTRGADGRAELVGELVHALEVVGAAEGAPARDDARGGLQVRPLGVRGAQLDEARVARRSRCAASGSRSARPRAALPAAAYDASRTVATNVVSLGARTVTIALPA